MIYGRLTTFKNLFKFSAATAAALFLSSCQEALEVPASGKRVDALGKFAGTGQGYIYEVNPIIATGNSRLSYPRMGDYVTARNVTDNNTLETKCFFTDPTITSGSQDVQTSGDCLDVLNDKETSTTPLQSADGGWAYPAGSDEFYQVNSFYHVNSMLERFHQALTKTSSNVYLTGASSNQVPPATKYQMGQTGGFWFTSADKDPNTGIITSVGNATLKVFSKCFQDPFNAYFSPAENEICLGWNEQRDWLYIAQDPSVIYHELGHALVKVMMNQRNTGKNGVSYLATPYESDLGNLSYDEAGAINEGVADWFSYFMNGRTHFGEWALGRFFDSSRPMTEEDETHNGLVSKNSGERLSYPQYLYYDPNRPATEVEDIHYAGQIVSHYLVSLTEEFKTSCSVSSHEGAADLTLMLLNETLAEIGDMTGRGSDVFDEFRNDPNNYLTRGSFFTNLNNQESYRWSHQVNPPNFRRFFQTFAKNIKHHIIRKNLCAGFNQDDSESLLDEYGLLLFNDYNEVKKGVEFTDMGNYVDGSATDTSSQFFSDFFGCGFSGYIPVNTFCPAPSSGDINLANRNRTVLASKELLEHRTDDEEVTPTYILDSQSEIRDYISSLTFEGKPLQISEGTAGTEYNNNNIKISPGEIVGILLNLFNNSNSTMAGVQLLANDWDHMKLSDPAKTYVNTSQSRNAGKEVAHWAPCQFDGWPLESENGVVDANPASPSQGDCGYASRTNFVFHQDADGDTSYYQDAPQPVCMVQFSSENETQWVAQDFFRKNVLDLGREQCLNPDSGNDFNPNECLIRFLPGADQAILGKIEPQKSFTQTLQSDDSSGLEIGYHNIMLMEVNKRVAPGTTFACRLRARFSNCSDCYDYEAPTAGNEDNREEYAEYEMTGHKPFKIINFKFTVLQ